MTRKMVYEVTPGGALGAAEWVCDMWQARERERYSPGSIPLAAAADAAPIERLEILPSLSRWRAGHAAFAELKIWAYKRGDVVLDYCDGHGGRPRLGPLVAEPASDLGAWEIEVS